MMLQETMIHEEIIQHAPSSDIEDGSPSPQEEQDPLEESLKEQFLVQRIQELTQSLEQMKEVETKRKEAWEKLQKTRRQTTNLFLYVLALGILSVLLAFYREISQVGWNLFCSIAGILQFQPETLAGLLMALAAALLFWKVVKWTFQAAMDDFFGSQEEFDDDFC